MPLIGQKYSAPIVARLLLAKNMLPLSQHASYWPKICYPYRSTPLIGQKYAIPIVARLLLAKNMLPLS